MAASGYDQTPMSSLSPSASSASVVQIGEGSYSSGDVYVECLLPNVLQPQLLASTGKSAGKQKKTNQSNHGLDHSRSSQRHDTSHPGVVTLALEDHPAVLQAQEECQTLLNGNDVSVVEDHDVKEDTVQILGTEAELVFPTRNIFRYLVMFVKHLDEFLEFNVEIVDDKQTYRQFKVTNARSLARVEMTSCQLPLALGNTDSKKSSTQAAWRYVCLDLQTFTSQAFGTKHVTTTQIRIGGNCRLLRLFFQDELYEDSDLPEHLTFLG